MRATAGIVGLGSLAVLAGCAASGPEIVSYHGDYPSYATVAELCADSQLVVIVTPVSSEVREVDLSAAPGDTPEENPSLGAETPDPQPAFIVVETVTTVTVDRVLKGEAKAGSELEVGQPGGTLDDVIYEAERFELSKGTPALLFLNVWDNDVPASPLNPTQGAYALDEAGYLVPVRGNPAVAAGKVVADEAICA